MAIIYLLWVFFFGFSVNNQPFDHNDLSEFILLHGEAGDRLGGILNWQILSSTVR